MAEPFDDIDLGRLHEAAIARDERLQLIEQAVDVESEIRGSRAWAYFMACADELREQALAALATVAAHDQNRIRQLQAQAAIKSNIDGFLVKMTIMADEANRLIRIEEGHEAEDV